MAAVSSYKYAHPLMGTIALIFIASYKDHDDHLRAESHVIFADATISPKSESIKFEHSPHENGAVQVTEDVMAEIALDHAKSHLEQFANGPSELRREFFSHAALSEATPQDLLQAWVRKKFPKMKQLSHQTESEDLRNYIQSFTKYSPLTISAV
jgi:hypothetical protein